MMYRLLLLLAIAPLAATAPAPAAAETLERSALVPEAADWAALVEGLEAPGGRLGFDAQQMSQFSRDRFLLDTVRNLFGDLASIPRFSGKLAEDLVEAASRPEDLLGRAFLLLDVSAGRMLPLSEGWGLEDVPAESSPLEVLEELCSRDGGRLSQRARGSFARLPSSVQRLLLRLVIGQLEAEDWLAGAFDEGFLREATGAEREAPSLEALLGLASAPWRDERLGQLASRSKASFVALEKTELEALAFGSTLWAAHLRRALEEFAAAGGLEGVDPLFEQLEFRVASRRILLTGRGPGTWRDAADLQLDLGGDDLYLGRHAASAGPGRPLSVLVELGGDDVYEAGDLACSFGCGLFGLGALVDLDGDDRYAVAESGLGAAWHGVGLLLDQRGRDEYSVKGRWGQGAAHVGVGLLVDGAGDDRYSCGSESQGLGSTLGAGLLLDVSGDDSYLARDDGNVSELYLGQSVAMSQGCGYGRRADLGDGRSLAGGFGVLVDGAGQDSYHAQVWSQGAGYWWAVGILEDLGGDDNYRNGKYSSGAAAHFAIGSHVDLSGNDSYNVGNTTAKNQYQGHARDGSIGVFIDGAGDDNYWLRSHCGGSADLASLALFWDRSGEDTYRQALAPGEAPGDWAETPPFGSATLYPPFRSFRDDFAAVGLFLDTGGEDEYPAGLDAADDSRWTRDRSPVSRGRGLDR